MAAPMEVPATNGDHVRVVTLKRNGHSISVDTSLMETKEGTLTIKASYSALSPFEDIPNGVIDLASPHSLTFNNPVKRYLFTLSGVSGAGTIRVRDDSGIKGVSKGYTPEVIPESAISEDGALVTTDSVDNAGLEGNQFESAFTFLSLVTSASAVIGFATGAKSVVVEDVSFAGTFLDADVDVYKNSVYTGGTSQDIYNVNDNSVNAPLSTVVIAPTVSNDGDVFVPSSPLLGLAAQGNKVLNSSANGGSKKILKPNTKYILRLTNNALSTLALLRCHLYWREF